MREKNNRKQGLKAKSALTGLVAFALTMPAGLAAADSSYGLAAEVNSFTATAVASPISREPAAASEADLSKVKYTKDQALAKLKALFPILEKAEVSNVELGITNMYPAPANQIVWNIQWNYQTGNGGYGFSSQVDALNGDLISTYLSFPNQRENESYYPPSLTRDQALEKAKAFIAKAAPSVSVNDLEAQDGNNYLSNPALFGPVQYGFNFTLKKNGIYSSLENLYVTVGADGAVWQFNKSPEHWSYPSASASVTQEQAEKAFADRFDVELVYMPVYNLSGANSWMLGWRPAEQALYAIDALSGERLDAQGAVSAVTASVYSDVPQTSKRFISGSGVAEMTSDEAAKRVKQVVAIPAARKLVSSSLGSDYANSDRKVWRLTWMDTTSLGSGYPSQSYAEVDAVTGEILGYNENQPPSSAGGLDKDAVAKGSKLTQQQAKQKAIALINLLYPDAAGKLKLVERKDNAAIDGTGFSFQFLRFYKGIAVGDGGLTLALDNAGALRAYNVPRTTDLEKANLDPSAIKVTKEEARAQSFDRYKVRLQYQSFGGYTVTGYTEPKIKLVYAPVPPEPEVAPEAIDALTGKLTVQYPTTDGRQKASTASDIGGHPAEQALATMVEYNILATDENGKVNPGFEMTAGDWLTWMAKAVTPFYAGYYGGAERKTVAGVSPESPYYDAVFYAVQNQWIDSGSTFQPDAKLTREGLAAFLSSIIHYNKFSAYLQADPAVTQFGDAASINRKGEVAVAVKLGLLQGEQGKFNPAGIVTRADAATVMMKLVALQGKTDQIIGQSRYY